MQSPEARPSAAKPPDGAPRGATRSKRSRDKRTGCAPWRAVPLAFRGEGQSLPPAKAGEANLRRLRAARTMELA